MDQRLQRKEKLSLLSAGFRLLDRFFFAEIDVRQLAALRIASSAIALATLIGLWGEAQYFLSYDGTFAPQFASPHSPSWSVLSYFNIGNAAGLDLFFSLSIFSCLLFMFGMGTRISAFLTFVALVSCFTRNPHMTYGGDVVLKILVFYLALSPCGRAWSLDSIILRNRIGSKSVEAWPLRLIQFHIALLYFMAGWGKLHYVEWIQGTAIASILSNPHYSFFWEFFRKWNASDFSGLLAIPTWIVAFFEVFFPVLIIYPKSRPIAIAIGLVLHLSITVLMKLYLFGPVMLTAYLALLPNPWFSKLERVRLPRFRKIWAPA